MNSTQLTLILSVNQRPLVILVCACFSRVPLCSCYTHCTCEASFPAALLFCTAARHLVLCVANPVLQFAFLLSGNMFFLVIL